jgi:hypothetical protein
MSADALKLLYLDLMKRCLLGLIGEDPPVAIFPGGRLELFHPGRFDAALREKGLDWPSKAHSMIGLPRMDNIQHCVESAISDGVEGDLMETGVWRGGATIFMRAVLKAHAVQDRCVWVADSFQGLPSPNIARYPADAGSNFAMANFVLGVPLSQVKENFRRYGLLDEQVRFLEGWFRDTLPEAPIKRLAVLRLDGDLYESTMDALTPLYPKLSVGGYLIVDDYGLSSCRQAVEQYRKDHGITETLVKIDWNAVFWRRER